MDGAPMRKIADQRYAQAVDAPKLALNGVEVEERLSGVLVGAIAGVNDGHFGHGSHARGGPFLVVADDDAVSVASHDTRRVFQRLALRALRMLARVLGADDDAAQTHHRHFKREARTRARLIEQRGQHAAMQVVGAATTAHDLFHGPGAHKEVVEQAAIDVRSADEVAWSIHTPSVSHLGGVAGRSYARRGVCCKSLRYRWSSSFSRYLAARRRCAMVAARSTLSAARARCNSARGWAGTPAGR